MQMRSLFCAWMLILAIPSCSRKQETPAEPIKAAAPTQSTTPALTQQHKLPALPQAPASLGPIRIPDDNSLTPEKVRLGQRLFFDRRLSVDGSHSCYDCHQNEDGTGGHDPIGTGAQGKPLTRHAPILWNVAYLPRLYWDGRADSLEAVAKGAWSGPNMGVGEENLGKKSAEIGALPEYKDDFDNVFPADGATPGTIEQALASYERTLFCGDTAWDRYIAGQDSALTPEQKQGWELFKGKAACNACHVPPFFSDAYLSPEGAFHNNGIGMEGKKESEVDIGRMKVTSNPSDWALFKTPSLRNVSKSAPYFHNGAIAKLEDAVRFMAKGGFKNKNRDSRLVDKQLSDPEIKSLVAFLGSLECTGRLVPAP